MHPVLDVALPVQVRFVFAIEAQQQRVERKPSDPPASLNGPVLHVFGKLQYIQPSFSVVAQTQQAPQRQREPVHHTASTPTHAITHTYQEFGQRIRASLITHRHHARQAHSPGLDVYEAVDEFHIV